MRDYHSTAILLPDARVLSAGGNESDSTDFGNIYCPPYLFNPQGNLLSRPVYECTPPSLGYNQCFKILTPQAAKIKSACLIRPGAATHGYDQSQRYVPLDFTKGTDPPRLVVTSPATVNHAPPGDYMLFVVDSTGGYNVPAVARWVRLNDTSASCDVTPPDSAADFYAEFVSPNSVGLVWTAPGDDGSQGTASSYDVRRSTSPINTETSFTAGTQAQNEPLPQLAGENDWFEVTQLASCTKYYFALRTRDEVCNYSQLHQQQVWGRTLCGGGGGGFSARETRSEGDGAPGSAPEEGGGRSHATAAGPGDGPIRATANALSAVLAANDFIVETDRAVDGWRITVRVLPPDESSPAAEGNVTIQQRDSAGDWKTRARFRRDLSEDVLGLSALRDRGRMVIRGGYQLQKLAGAFARGSSIYVLTAAVHSRVGALDPAVVTAGDATALVSGESLSLTYAPGGDDTSPPESWYMLAGRSAVGVVAQNRAGSRGGESPAARNALHQNTPNPFSGTTSIAFELARAGSIRLEVFDLVGRRVQTLAQGRFPAGEHRVEWDRRESSGRRAAAGIYVYRLTTGEFTARLKLVLFP